jgi:hypothetical protein
MAGVNKRAYLLIVSIEILLNTNISPTVYKIGYITLFIGLNSSASLLKLGRRKYNSNSNPMINNIAYIIFVRAVPVVVKNHDKGFQSESVNTKKSSKIATTITRVPI